MGTRSHDQKSGVENSTDTVTMPPITHAKQGAMITHREITVARCVVSHTTVSRKPSTAVISLSMQQRPTHAPEASFNARKRLLQDLCQSKLHILSFMITSQIYSHREHPPSLRGTQEERPAKRKRIRAFTLLQNQVQNWKA